MTQQSELRGQFSVHGDKSAALPSRAAASSAGMLTMCEVVPAVPEALDCLSLPAGPCGSCRRHG